MSRFLPCAAALLLLAGPAALAQNAPAATAPASPNTYTGPRFPGGPDSLRAALGRVLRPAKQALAGQLFVRLELNRNGQPSNYSFLTPPDKSGSALIRGKEIKAVLQQLPAQLGNWELGTSTTAAQPGNVVILPLDFGLLPEPLPLLYSDESPVFFSLSQQNSPLMSPTEFIQRQFRYPAEDLRNRVEGSAYGYYEVSETGAVENRRVVGSLSASTDAELRRVLNTLPNALAPPRHQGRPVRVAYVVPINLRMM